MQVPEFLLRRLYVKGSLRNTEGGFAFDLRNSLGAGYAEQVLPLSLDGDQLPLSAARFVVDGVTTPFAAVSSQAPFTLAMDGLVTVEANAPALTDGKHRIGIGFIVTGMGEMRNALIVRAAHAVIAIGGGWGTLSEIALARRIARPVVGLRDAFPPAIDIPRVDTPAEAVERALAAAGA